MTENPLGRRRYGEIKDARTLELNVRDKIAWAEAFKELALEGRVLSCCFSQCVCSGLAVLGFWCDEEKWRGGRMIIFCTSRTP